MSAGVNPYSPFWLGETINFDYNGKNVWGTIRKFGKDFVTCLTKDGHRNYKWNNMGPVKIYQCGVDDLIMHYERFGDKNFEYLYRFYGPSKPTVQWKED